MSGKKEEKKAYVKEGKNLSTVFCYTAKTFPFLPGCCLFSQPSHTLLHGVNLSSIMDFAFHITPISPACESPSEEQRINFSTWISEGTSCPIAWVIDEDIKQCQPQYWPWQWL